MLWKQLEYYRGTKPLTPQTANALNSVPTQSSIGLYIETPPKSFDPQTCKAFADVLLCTGKPYYPSKVIENRSLSITLSHEVCVEQENFFCYITIDLSPDLSFSSVYHSPPLTRTEVVIPFLRILEKEKSLNNLEAIKAIAVLKRYIACSRYHRLPLSYSSLQKEIDRLTLSSSYVNIKLMSCYFWAAFLKTPDIKKVMEQRVGKQYSKACLRDKLSYLIDEYVKNSDHENLVEALESGRQHCIKRLEKLVGFNYLTLKQAGNTDIIIEKALF